MDVRSAGSGNVGATNVARTAGGYAGIVTLLADVSKGALPVWIAGAIAEPTVIVAATGFAAFFGHLFPIFSRFRGGKGVATAAGVFAVLAPAALAVSIVVFAGVVASTRIVSLASLSAVTALPVVIALCGPRDVVLVVAVLIAASVWVAHRDNVRRLVTHTEPRFQTKR